MAIWLVGLPVTLWLVLIGAALWLAARASGRRAVWIVSGLGALALVLLAVDILLGCAADPVFYPPAAGEAGDGRVVHACDGPAGVVAYLTVWITVPIALAGQGLLTWWLLDKARS